MKLYEIGIIITGNTPSKKIKEYYESNDIMFIKPGDIEEKYITNLKKSEDYISEKARNKVRILPKGTVLVTSIGTIGKVGILENEATCNQQINAIIPIDMIISKYLAYLIKSKQKKLQLKANAPVVPIINKTDFSKIEINICDREEQKKIVKKLDLTKKIIDIRKKQIEELNIIIKSQFVEMFENKNYPKIKGKDLFVFSSGKFLESHKRLKEGIPVYGGNGIVWYTDKELIDYNTIVIGRVGAYCGNVKLVRELAWITDNAIYIKQFKKDVYNIDFLFNMMEAINFFKFAQKSGQPKITQKPLEEYNYIVPPIDEQLNFSNIVKQIDKQKFEIEKSLKEAQELYESLMEKYFG